VAIDVTVCDIENQIVATNPEVQTPPPMPENTKFSGCKCALSYTYKDKTFKGGMYVVCCSMCIAVFVRAFVYLQGPDF